MRFLTWFISPVALSLTLSFALAGPKPLEPVALVLMGTNDIHGALAPEEMKSRETEGTPPVTYYSAGLDTLAGYVRVLREEFGSRLLWLDAGDQFQGTLESNMEEGASVVKFFNLAQLGAAAIGNHEFDYGPEGDNSKDPVLRPDQDPLGALKSRMREARYPYLAANILDRATGAIPQLPNISPRKIFQAGSLKVGVFGLSTTDTPKTTRSDYIRALMFTKLREATLREARALREEGADVVVLTAHVGLKCSGGGAPRSNGKPPIRTPGDPQGECGSGDEMVELLRSLPGGTLDAVVSGHSHQLVHHWVAGVPVIQAGSLGRFFNLIYLEYDPAEKRVLPGRSRIEGPVPVCPAVFKNQGDCNGDRPAPSSGRGALVAPTFHGKKVTPDTEVTRMIEPALARAAQAKSQVLGTAARTLHTSRDGESPLGNLVSDAAREATQADVAFVNAGGIRAPIDAGTITYGDVFRVLPFDNALVTLNVSGQELKTILRIAFSGSRGIQPISGMELQLIDYSKTAPGSDLDGDGVIAPWEADRILEARFTNGRPIILDEMYRLTTLDFLVAGGGDVGWALGKIPSERQEHTGFLVRDVVAKRVQTLFESFGPLHTVERPLTDSSRPRIRFVR